jgi:hypothetical protein
MPDSTITWRMRRFTVSAELRYERVQKRKTIPHRLTHLVQSVRKSETQAVRMRESPSEIMKTRPKPFCSHTRIVRSWDWNGDLCDSSTHGPSKTSSRSFVPHLLMTGHRLRAHPHRAVGPAAHESSHPFRVNVCLQPAFELDGIPRMTRNRLAAAQIHHGSGCVLSSIYQSETPSSSGFAYHPGQMILHHGWAAVHGLERAMLFRDEEFIVSGRP